MKTTAGPVDAGASVETLERQLEAAETALAELVEREDLGETEGVKRRSRAAAKVWHLRALLLGRKSEPQEAARAASQAAAAEELAIKAAKADIVTRVEQLEEMVKQARTQGQGVRALAKQRKRTKPPGADPR